MKKYTNKEKEGFRYILMNSFRSSNFTPMEWLEGDNGLYEYMRDTGDSISHPDYIKYHNIQLRKQKLNKIRKNIL